MNHRYKWMPKAGLTLVIVFALAAIIQIVVFWPKPSLAFTVMLFSAAAYPGLYLIYSITGRPFTEMWKGYLKSWLPYLGGASAIGVIIPTLFSANLQGEPLPSILREILEISIINFILSISIYKNI